MGVHVSPARPDASAGADCNDGQTFGNKCACYVDCCRGQVEGSGVKGVRRGGESKGVRGDKQDHRRRVQEGELGKRNEGEVNS